MSTELEKIIAWATILDVEDAFYRNDKLQYGLINKLLRDYGYRALQKAFMRFVVTDRKFRNSNDFLAALFKEASQLSEMGVRA